MITLGQSRRGQIGGRLAAIVGFMALQAGVSWGTSLAEANGLWAGARCTLRIPIEIKKGRDGEGWSSSPLYAVEDPLDGQLYWTLLVSDRRGLEPVMRGKELAVGTVLTASGWRLLHPGDEEGVTLDLRHEGVELRFRFRRFGSFGKDSLPLSRLAQAERYIRFEVCAPIEADPLPVAPLPLPAAAPTPREPVAVHRPALRVDAAAVQPPRAAAGEQVELVAIYRLEGIPPASFFEVVEQREIFLGDVLLQRLEETFPRTADDYTSSWPVVLPAGLGPGVYRLVVTVRTVGLEGRAEALFEVTP